MVQNKRVIGIIGGSGIYAIEALDAVQRVEVETPWGKPSDSLVKGTIADVDLVFLARHGNGHAIPPHQVNYRANIDALKRAGVTDLISLSACGSFKEALPPGMFVIADQFIDRTGGREKSFFESGFVAHVSMADPVCPALAEALEISCSELSIPNSHGGTYICIDGPQFSSRAESNLYKSWGCDVIGMTAMPEAKLAREAELPYAIAAMVTDYDCWNESEGAVEVAKVLETIKANKDNAAKLIENIAVRLGPERTPSPSGVEKMLDMAVITPPSARSSAALKKLDAVAGRFLKR
ncbi:S-methyl-5'-thioadenosine phosphorylase [Hyphococcus flavus]|uniref:S-methyl-5'-thioadenosine phosphorylase n=1 Tax=Hyphococcus flavus TaxID=1866326 RepID=A0AAF0CEG8_9PROT|nr:S-methyl-5'-thioadenosine phosphorylase [Hyphococcus flavus]WDI31226.1 S-methyl-5'-thioadenosine phosphorylase [Hyphococcus flavus]